MSSIPNAQDNITKFLSENSKKSIDESKLWLL